MSLIIDCDPGNGIPGANVDDALALCLAWCAPELDLKSVWTVFGNVSAAEGAQCAQHLAEVFGADTPVITGCDAPLDTSMSRSAWREKMDAPRGTADVRELWRGHAPAVDCEAAAPCPKEVAAKLARDVMSHAHSDPVTIAALGPLTNVAALIQFEPEAARHVAEVRIMGGCLGYDDLVDTNFAIDPLAASIVFNSGIDLTLVPLDVTRTTRLSLEHWQHLKHRALETTPEQRKRAHAIDAWLSPWIEYSTRTRPVDGMWVHDMVVIAQLICPDVVEEEAGTYRLRANPRGKLVSSCSQGIGGSAERNDEHFLTGPTRLTMVTAVDNDKLLALWSQRVLGA